ncbi:MAG: hypothetical protein WCG67_07775 [Ferruginibacter sp.]
MLQNSSFSVNICPMNTLTATKRSKTDKLSAIRSNGMVPAVVYGAQVENTLVSVSNIDFEKIFKSAGESSTIVLEINSEGTKKDASVKAETTQNQNTTLRCMQVQKQH